VPTDVAHPALFERLRAFARESNPAIHAALEDGEIVSHDRGLVRIRVPAAFAARRLQERTDALAEIASRFFDATTRVEIADAEELAPAAGTLAGGDDDLRRRRQAALNDPGVSRALEVLDGEIVEILPFGAPR
jgi:hypothetical protein